MRLRPAPAALAVALAGCVGAGSPDPLEEATPATDDDASGGAVVPVLGHPPGWGEHPEGPDGESDLAPCTVEEVLGDGCEESEVRAAVTDMPGCPAGVFVHADGAQWAALATACGDPSAGPGVDVDWDAEVLLVHSDRGEGCGASAGALWVAACEESSALGVWFYACGPCGDPVVRQVVAALPVGALPVDVVECVPYAVRCGT